MTKRKKSNAKQAKVPQKRKKRSGLPDNVAFAPMMSEREFARLGDGRVAYIKELTSDEARQMFPEVQGLPNDINLFALQAADGTPIALTDSRQAAVSRAMGDELQIAHVH